MDPIPDSLRPFLKIGDSRKILLGAESALFLQRWRFPEVEIKEIRVWRHQSILASLHFPLNDARYLNWPGTEESLEKATE